MSVCFCPPFAGGSASKTPKTNIAPHPPEEGAARINTKVNLPSKLLPNRRAGGHRGTPRHTEHSRPHKTVMHFSDDPAKPFILVGQNGEEQAGQGR